MTAYGHGLKEKITFDLLGWGFNLTNPREGQGKEKTGRTLGVFLLASLERTNSWHMGCQGQMNVFDAR